MIPFPASHRSFSRFRSKAPLAPLCVLAWIAALSASHGGPPSLTGKIWFVAPSSPQEDTGEDWAHALPDIGAAVELAAEGDSIWVAAGVYGTYATPGKLYHYIFGGFAGTESSLNQRDWRANVSHIRGVKIPSQLAGYTGISNHGQLDGFRIGPGGVVNEAGALLIHCRISGNSGPNSNGIYNSGAVVDCIVDDCHNSNFLGYAIGGGIWNAAGGVVSHCVVSKNGATGFSGQRGGGIFNRGEVINTISWGNTPDDIHNDGGVVSYSLYGGAPHENGNLDGYPNFVDVTSGDPNLWDFRLAPGSAAIDRGLNADADAPATDYDGAPRPVDGDGDGIAAADLGPFEQEEAPTGPFPPTPDAAFVGHTCPPEIELGQSLLVGVTMRNTGDISWKESRGFMLLRMTDGCAPALEGSLSSLPPFGSIQPGDAYQFVVEIRAPLAPGPCSAVFTLVGQGGFSVGQVASVLFEAVAPPHNEASHWVEYE